MFVRFSVCIDKYNLHLQFFDIFFSFAVCTFIFQGTYTRVDSGVIITGAVCTFIFQGTYTASALLSSDCPLYVPLFFKVLTPDPVDGGGFHVLYVPLFFKVLTPLV